MHIRPTQISRNNKSNNHDTPLSDLPTVEYGSSLLRVPAELLTHITSHLDVPTLFALSRVSSLLHDHVADDNTWYRAFLCQILNIPAECDPENERMIMLRRYESSWKRELVIRYNLSRRWERSRNTTTTHTPHHSPIIGMHMMPANTLLAASLQYGVVSRSAPLTGKVLRGGYLDAFGGSLGNGIGNPNAEFAPNLLACAISSDGGTARILWGFTSGELSITTAPRAMDTAGRSNSRVTRPAVPQQLHLGAVTCVAWDPSKEFVVSGGADGLVKLWDAKTLECLWTGGSEGYITHVCCDVKRQNLVVAAFRSGDVYAWSGVTPSSGEPIRANTTRISALTDDAQVASLTIDTSASIPTLLIAYANSAEFYRVRVISQNEIDKTPFGDHSYISCVSFHDTFVIAGEVIGCISIYDWKSASPPSPGSASTERQSPIGPVHTFPTSDTLPNPITAIFWNGITLITGSSNGTLTVFDGLTFRLLRHFPSTSRLRRHHDGELDDENVKVREILVSPDRQVLIVSAGERITAWKAGVVAGAGRHGKGIMPRHTGRKKKDDGIGKWQQQIELTRDIKESRKMLADEHVRVQQTFNREKAQRVGLESLGLSEAEAIEYLVMLSRDEEEAKRKRSVEEEWEAERAQMPEWNAAETVDRGVFDDDFEDEDGRIAHNGTYAASPDYNNNGNNGNVSSSLECDIRRLPGFGNAGPSGSNNTIPTTTTTTLRPTIDDPEVFPSITPPLQSPSPISINGARTHSATTPPTRTSSSWTRTSTNPSTSSSLSSCSTRSSGTGTGKASAWQTPLSSSPSFALALAGGSPPLSSSLRAEEVQKDAGQSKEENEEGEMDDDLKLAIELSLAEARSLGEAV